MSETRPRVLIAGTWDEGPGYPRTAALCAGLRASGAEVLTVREPLPEIGCARSTFLRQPWRWCGFAVRLLRTRRRLRARVRRVLREQVVDRIVVPYPGHLAVRWLRGLSSVPVVLDLFLSAYGTAVEDRRLFGATGWMARAMRAIDRRACAAADLVLLDTPQHVERVQEWIDVHVATGSRFAWLPIGDPAATRAAVALPERASGAPLELLFFGTGVALHGLRTLLDAVARTPRVRLTLVGGTASERSYAADTLAADNLVLGAEFESMARIRERIAAAHLVAGIFGVSRKADAVVPFKVVHALAAGRPVLTGDTSAVRELLQPGVDCFVAPVGDAEALATRIGAIETMPMDVLAAVGSAARARYDATFSMEALARRCAVVFDHCSTQPAPQPIAGCAAS